MIGRDFDRAVNHRDALLKSGGIRMSATQEHLRDDFGESAFGLFLRDHLFSVNSRHQWGGAVQRMFDFSALSKAGEDTNVAWLS